MSWLELYVWYVGVGGSINAQDRGEKIVVLKRVRQACNYQESDEHVLKKTLIN